MTRQASWICFFSKGASECPLGTGRGGNGPRFIRRTIVVVPPQIADLLPAVVPSALSSSCEVDAIGPMYPFHNHLHFSLYQTAAAHQGECAHQRLPARRPGQHDLSTRTSSTYHDISTLGINDSLGRDSGGRALWEQKGYFFVLDGDVIMANIRSSDDQTVDNQEVVGFHCQVCIQEFVASAGPESYMFALLYLTEWKLWSLVSEKSK